jgi:putative Mg2+ transporter-C (MgtC) family protein
MQKDILDLVNNELEILWFFLPKILVATICGFIVGYDREVRNKVAGIRTNVIIAVGCTILTTISFWLSKNNPDVDPTRMLGQIITGIGFLGAGVIMRTEDKITGVTTAAFIWTVSAIGIMVGCGTYIIPIVITVGLMVVSKMFEKIEKKIKENRQ